MYSQNCGFFLQIKKRKKEKNIKWSIKVGKTIQMIKLHHWIGKIEEEKPFYREIKSCKQLAKYNQTVLSNSILGHD